MLQGGFCDCEVLYNVVDESRLKAEYWIRERKVARHMIRTQSHSRASRLAIIAQRQIGEGPQFPTWRFRSGPSWVPSVPTGRQPLRDVQLTFMDCLLGRAGCVLGSSECSHGTGALIWSSPRRKPRLRKMPTLNSRILYTVEAGDCYSHSYWWENQRRRVAPKYFRTILGGRAARRVAATFSSAGASSFRNRASPFRARPAKAERFFRDEHDNDPPSVQRRGCVAL